MTKKVRISSFQLAALLVGSRLMLAYTFLPVIDIPPANQDAWVVSLYSILFQIVMFIPTLYVTNKYRGKTDLEATQLMFGKAVSRIMATLFVGFLLFCFFNCVLMDVVFLNNMIFPETPKWGLLIFIVIPIAYTAYRGIGTVSRMSTLIVGYIVLTIMFFFIISVTGLDLDNLKPVLADSSFGDLTYGAFLNASTKSEVFFFFILTYFMDENVKVSRLFFVQLFASHAFELMMLIPTICVLGVDISKHAANAYFLFTKQLSAYDFIQRIESLSVLAWFFGSLLRASLFCTIGSHILSGVCGIKKKNTFVLPFCALITILILIPFIGTSNTLNKLTSPSILPWVNFPFVFVIPVMMVAATLIRKILSKQKHTNRT